jgi:NAD(P)-dependent dehydrogenase (short-subunit alcohol dehydrogenase family)
MITGASRGMGVAFSKAALAAGDRVVATGRRPEEIGAVLGESSSLFPVKLDVTNVDDAHAAADAAVARFGRIDVVVNNAGASFKGYFEEMSPEQVAQQLATNLVGPMNVTRAVLPVMRRQRSGHVIAISSGAGLVGFEYSSVYAASKSGLEGWMGALDQEVAPFGIHTTIINPGFFRTTLASPESLIWPALAIDDYAERSAAQRTWWASKPATPTSLPKLCSRSSMKIRHLAASSRAPMSSRWHNARSTNSATRSNHTASCRPRSRSIRTKSAVERRAWMNEPARWAWRRHRARPWTADFVTSELRGHGTDEERHDE